MEKPSKFSVIGLVVLVLLLAGWGILEWRARADVEETLEAKRSAAARVLTAQVDALKSGTRGGLYSSVVGDQTMKQLTNSAQLRFLEAGWSQITNVGVKVLPSMPLLEEVSLPGTRISNAGMESLGQVLRLEALNLNHTVVGDEGIVHLKELKRLRELRLRRTRITDQALATIGTFRRLEELGVAGTEVTDAGLAHLTQLTNLRELRIGNTKITDDGLVHLANLTELRTLSLRSDDISDAGIAHLLGLTNLGELLLHGTKVTAKGVAQLAPLENLTLLGVPTLDDEMIESLKSVKSLAVVLVPEGTISEEMIGKLEASLTDVFVYEIDVYSDFSDAGSEIKGE